MHGNYGLLPTEEDILNSKTGLFFWHTVNTLELALMDKVVEEEEEPQEFEPFRYAGSGAPVRWLHRVG